MPTIVDFSAVASRIGIFIDGSVLPGELGIDGEGNAYSGTQLGTGVTISGIPFVYGTPNALDAVTNQNVALPSGKFDTLYILGTGVNGNRPSETLTVNYSDLSSDSFSRSFSDWFTPQSYAGETIAATTAYRNNSDGSNNPGPFYLYLYALAINSAKTVASIDLPAETNVPILAMTLNSQAPSGSTIVPGRMISYIQDRIV